MHPVLTGSLIAGYRIEEEIGKGGMGVVYRATQVALRRPVALKLIAPELADDERFRERFKRESRLAASIDHPNVIPIYEAGESDGSLFISMRWVDGTNLLTLIRRGGGLDPKRAVAIIVQLAAALDAAHSRGVVHRDVKPANVLVATGEVEHAYLTDFGLVKSVAGGRGLTRSGEMVGTIDYISPEQIRGEGSDACSDVYSLGCVLFECLAGRVPFDADTDVAKIYAHLNDRPPRLSGLVSGLPGALDSVVNRAMAKDRAKRYRSAGDLARAAVIAANAIAPPKGRWPVPRRGGVTAPIVDRETRRPRGRQRDRRRPRLGIGLVLLAGVVAGVLAAGGMLGGADEAEKSSVPSLADGTILQTQGGRNVYVMKGGARFGVPPRQRAAFGYDPDTAPTLSRPALRSIPLVPRDGTLLRSFQSTLVWVVRGQQRQIAAPRPGADVLTVPSTGLLQIPTPLAGRRTSVAITAPASITEGRKFVLSARVRSPNGVPTGACLFFRIGLGRLKERANVRSHDGRCEARLKVGGRRKVRYSVHFYGERGWRNSSASTPEIQVALP
jgi:predicted Ser/Thr protein kinase